VAPALLLLRVSLYAGGGTSGYGIGGGGLYVPGSWSLQGYRALAAPGSTFPGILRFTLLLGGGVTLLTLAVAYPLALYIRGLTGRLRAVALGAVVLPKLANLLVVVYGLKLVLGASGPLNGLLLATGLADAPVDLLHNLTGVLVGKTYLVLPYAVLVLVAALDRIDPALAVAARGLGAGPLATFLRVTLPLSLPGLATAASLSLIWALGAFVTPALMGSPDELTVAVDVQRQAFENLAWPRAAAEAVVMAGTLVAVAAAARLAPGGRRAAPPRGGRGP
jgi:ABC-type spermidine/putrescine transport system permease subunit I